LITPSSSGCFKPTSI